MVLQNRSAYFSLDPKHPNRLEPGKTPLHTLIASMAFKNEKLWATLGCMGMGAPYFVLRYLLDYHGEVAAAGFEYGTAFVLTAGLMNLLLVLDAWDIALGKKE